MGAQFLEHLIRLNDVFVDLWRTGDRCPRAAHPAFKWIPSDRVRLEWGEWEMLQGRKQQRVLLPDAMLELPAQKRSIFLECEMGTQTIVPGPGVEAQGATLTKAARYQRFLADRIDGGPATHYSRQYPDGFTPRVLYLVQTPGRAASVNVALAEWRKGLGDAAPEFQVALTFEEGTAKLRSIAGVPAPVVPPKAVRPARKPLAVPPPAPPPAAPVPPPPPKSPREVTSSELRLLQRFVDETIATVKRVRAVFDELRRPDPPRFPASGQAAQLLLSRWAKR